MFGLLAKLKKTPVPSNPPKPVPEVETVTARKQDLKVEIPAQGTVEPVTVTRAASEVEGTVIAVSPRYEVGGNFKEGDVLVSEGLQDGEQLCVTALVAVIEGMEVKVVSRDGKPVDSEASAR